MAPVRHLFAMLACQDIQRSLAFYRDLLGGVEVYRYPPEDEGDLDFVTLQMGDSELGLGQITGDPMHGIAQLPATGHRVELCAYVEEIEAVVEALRAAGTPIVTEPADQPWGERVSYVEDPDGNLIMLTT